MMSSNKNKLNYRQASLTYDSPTINPRRNSLVKQNSEDLVMPKTNLINNDIRITVNNKFERQQKNFPHPKIAWDDEGKVEKIHEPIIARKCPETRKPPRSLKRHSSVDQDSILSCKEDIINKLKLLLKDEMEIPAKQNLSIFLNQNQNSKHARHDGNNQVFGDHHAEQMSPEENLKKRYNSESNPTTTLFQFRRNPVKKLETKNRTYGYQNNPKEPPNIIVPASEMILDEEQNSESTVITDNSQPINNIIIRPSTAKSRRELFSKRTNSAFNSVVASEVSNQRAPLQRSSSAPIRPEHAKSKFLATKRKLKVIKKKDAKSAKKWGEHGSESANTDSLNINTTVSKCGTEIVTMVSLVSPASSDTEEIPEIHEEEPKSRSNSPKKILTVTRREENVQKTPSLRRIVKQVSFQQSSIHAIRSFSAGFPGRKNSMVTSLMLGGSLKRASTVQKKQEKGITNTSVSDDDERVPKRRLLRSRSAHVECVSLDDGEGSTNIISTSLLSDDLLKLPTEPDINIHMEQLQTTGNVCDLEASESTSHLEPMTLEENSISNESRDGQQFFTPKEKECWTLYQKMSDKGVKVNYDTLLRGMLTPTEYRNRRQSLAASASLAEDSEDKLEPSH